MTTGTIEYQLRNVSKESEKCFVHDFRTNSNEFRQLIFDDFKGAFAILMGGCAICLFSFFTELVIQKKVFIILRKKERRRKNFYFRNLNFQKNIRTLNHISSYK
jgi:hypothetical protein